jgi:hypothetical protein
MDQSHLPLHNLLEACRHPERCPICALVEDAARRYMQSILYEQVNNVFFRAKLRQDAGFCSRHSHQLMEYKDALGTAIIMREMLANEQEGPASRSLLEIVRKKPGRACLVCTLERGAEKRYLDVLQDHSALPELRKTFCSGAGLCWPHYRLAIKKKRRMPGWFTEFQQQRSQALLAALDNFISSYNDSLGDKKPVIEGADKVVWQKAVGVVYGYKGRG